MRFAVKVYLAVLGTVCFNCKNDKPINAVNLEQEVQLNTPEEKLFKEPLSTALLWASLPDKIDNYDKVLLQGSILEEGLHQVKARYQEKAEDETHIDLELTDGHGPMATAIKNTILLKLSKEYMENTADGYTRVYVRNGNKVYESQRNYNKTCIVEYVIDQRFCISMKASNLSVKALWKFADKLNLEKY